jgi:hypothetical protein
VTELSVLTGGPGEVTTIRVHWFNENNVRREARVELRMNERDKPRTLEIWVNRVKVAETTEGLDCGEYR